ncbi:hypothetical protein G6F61_007877 [Rhizopus arrhizus]|nr:hypothetical protein G6F61_007877 [Rhizopus arrhizus]
MATILFTLNSNYYNCPQRVPLTEDNVQPTFRRLSEQSERRRSEQRRKSEASIERASMAERLSSVRQGRFPSNQQINASISKFLNSRVIQSQPMSEDGQLVLKDIQALLIALQRALFLKNSDELFQSMIYHTKRATELLDADNDELTIGIFAVLKIIKFFLFDSCFKDLLSNILLAAQTILVEGNMSDLLIREDAVRTTRESSSNQGKETHDAKPSNSHDNKVHEHVMSCLRNTFATLKKHHEYESPLKTLLKLLIIWTNRLAMGTSADDSIQFDQAGTTNSKATRQDKELAASEAKEVFERWTAGIELDPFLKKLNDLACAVKNDPQLSDLYDRTRALSEQSYQGNFDKQSWSQIIVELQGSSNMAKYRQKMMDLIDEAQVILQAFKNDAISKEISEKLYSLHQHLWKDKAILKPHLLDDLKMTLLPALIEQIKYIPLPQLVINDSDQYEVIIDSMILPGDTLMPETIEFKIDDYLKFFPHAQQGSSSVQGLFIHLSGIQTSMEDVSFCYKRQTGFLGIKDSGLASVNINGLSLSVRLTSDSEDRSHRFQVESCVCNISKLEVHVKESKHNNLYKVFNPVLTGMVKRQMAKEIENSVIQMFNKGDAKLTKHLGGRRKSRKEKRRGSFISQIAQSVNHKIIGIQ